MPRCPKCQSTGLRRSRTRGRWERWRKEITSKRPYRCGACGWRGWLSARETDLDGVRAHPAPADPPNLRGTLLARPDARQHFDVKELDRFHSEPHE